ncbi:26S proteasome regulatory subunit [Ascosphaera atra]|nr:26S proteasome regulatory subunit [Ascosphaera atra]
MSADKINTFFEELRRDVSDESQAALLEFEDFWERKLWHQLTDSLLNYFTRPESAKHRIPLFKTFVDSFADKINQLKYAKLGLMASEQCSEDEKLDFLAAIAKKVDKPESQDAYVFALAEVAAQKLREKGIDGARADLDKAQAVLDTFDSVETMVHAAFYKVNADYYQVRLHCVFPLVRTSEHCLTLQQKKLEFASFYKTTLLYLACVNLEEMPKWEREQRAYDLSIAALVSEDIHNFGELLLHPILDSLKGTQHQWLYDMLFAFNKGDLASYDMLAGNLGKDQLLDHNKSFLQQKITLAALTEAAFRRPPQDRTMTFDSICQDCRVKNDEVELLVMKAFSRGLLKGKIDEVSQIVSITWVQPKVLDMKQIDQMRMRLEEWDAGVNQLGHWIEGAGKDVWAA